MSHMYFILLYYFCLLNSAFKLGFYTTCKDIVEYFEGFVKNYCNYMYLISYNKLHKFCTKPSICSYSTTRFKTELTVQICHNDCNCCHKFRVTVNMNCSVNILLLINLSSWMQLSPINMNILFLMA